jgi:hypothetical protein
MVWILIVLAVAAVAAVTILYMVRARRVATEARNSDELRTLFGVEYDRAVAEYGDRRTAEEDLHGRLEQAKTLALVPLTAEQHASFRAEWDAIQARVVEGPTRAVVDAEGLFEDVLLARGYPRSTGERMTTISIREPNLLDDYRAAHDVAVKALDQRANTEACRQAMLRYRRLFDAVLAPAPGRERLDLRERATVEIDERDRVNG